MAGAWVAARGGSSGDTRSAGLGGTGVGGAADSGAFVCADGAGRGGGLSYYF